MKFSSSALLAAALLQLASFPLGNAFQPGACVFRTPHETALQSSFGVEQAIPSDMPDIDPVSVTAKDLRSVAVTNVDGERVLLGDAMGRGTSIVVFLRHLGCFWCWSYAKAWMGLQQEIAGAEEITGPIFVSIGDPDRLNDFLEKNPNIPRNQIFVDGYDFKAYRQAGFGRFDEKPKELIADVNPQPVVLGGFQGWKTFLSSFMTLAPVTEDMKFPEMLSPEGIMWVGGTFVVRDNDMVYRWNDRIAGDHPEASEVLKVAKEAGSVSRKKELSFQNLFGLLS